MAGPAPRSAIRVSAGSAGWKSVPLVICDDGSTSRAIHSRGHLRAGGRSSAVFFGALPRGLRGAYWMPACTGVPPVQPCAGGTTKSTGKSPRMQSAKSAADRQLPIGDEIFLDHVGHFVG